MVFVYGERCGKEWNAARGKLEKSSRRSGTICKVEWEREGKRRGAQSQRGRTPFSTGGNDEEHDKPERAAISSGWYLLLGPLQPRNEHRRIARLGLQTSGTGGTTGKGVSCNSTNDRRSMGPKGEELHCDLPGPPGSRWKEGARNAGNLGRLTAGPYQRHTETCSASVKQEKSPVRLVQRATTAQIAPSHFRARLSVDSGTSLLLLAVQGSSLEFRCRDLTTNGHWDTGQTV